jgi:hypothetical protein
MNARSFPSVLMAWEGPGKKTSDPLARAAALARNDLLFSGPGTFRLKWQGASEGAAEDFTPDSVIDARDFRRDILARNPNALLLLEIRYENYPDDALPPDHPWWLRAAGGGRVQAFHAGFSKLDHQSAALRDHVAAQCRAAAASGAVDGCLFNAWEDSPDDVAMLQKIRAAVGEDFLLVAGSWRETPESAPYVNGLVLTMSGGFDLKAWGRSAQAVAWAGAHLREPRLVGLLAQQDRRQEETLRLATTLMLTRSDGYVLYRQPLGTVDARGGDWPSFWSKPLGRPLAPGQPYNDGLTSREFERGTAVYNPPGVKAARLSFPETRTSAATGLKGKAFTLASGDGDLYLK